MLAGGPHARAPPHRLLTTSRAAAYAHLLSLELLWNAPQPQKIITKTKALDSTRAPPRARTHAHSGLARMAASTASAPFTPLLHRRRASVHGRRGSGRAFVAVVVAAAAGGAPETEPSPATAAGAAAQGKKKTVDTRIHWSDPDEGWVGGNAKKDGGGRKKEPLGGRFADLINNPSESHYQLSATAASLVPFFIHN